MMAGSLSCTLRVLLLVYKICYMIAKCLTAASALRSRLTHYIEPESSQQEVVGNGIQMSTKASRELADPKGTAYCTQIPQKAYSQSTAVNSPCCSKCHFGLHDMLVTYPHS